MLHGHSSLGRRALVPALAAFLLLLGSGARDVARGAILGVDFDVSGAANTQSGFQSFPITSGNTNGPLGQAFPVSDPGVTSGSVTATVANGTSAAGTGVLLTRDRSTPTNTGTFTYANLYRDVLVANPSATTLVLQLSGLNPSTSYAVELFSYDNSNSSATVTFADMTAGSSGGTASYTYAGGTSNFNATTSNDVFGRTLTATSTAAGVLTFGVTTTSSNNSQAELNGFQISATPEPSSLAISIGAGALLLARRRRSL